VGSLENRLARLEEHFRVWHGPEEGEERALLIEEAMRRLSTIELAVLCEVLGLKAAHPDAGGVEHWRLMTDTQREMEVQWRRVVREVRSELEAPT
jgi:hypothetical protein